MPQLVALDIPGGSAFVEALQRVWAAGDAAAPLDPRLPRPAAERLLAALAPAAVVGPDGQRTALDGGRPVEAGDALVVATSGSTGDPRGVVLTRAAVEASARATSHRLGVDPATDTWLACLPLAHVGGLSVVTRALCTGTGLVVVPGFDALVVADLGRRRVATRVALVATALARVDAGLFTTVLLGGSAPPAGLAANVVTTYGMTETGSGVVYDGWPLDGVEVAIGTGRPGQGDEGEILLRGPMVARRYRDGTDMTVPGPDGAGRWLATGDGGRFESDGRLQVHGRLAELVVTGGEKVWPGPVERVLAGVAGVAEVAVWKRPDPEWGDRLVAWVVPADPGRPPTLADLRAAVTGELAPWAAPKELVLVDALPRTASGKVRRSALA